MDKPVENSVHIIRTFLATCRRSHMECTYTWQEYQRGLKLPLLCARTAGRFRGNRRPKKLKPGRAGGMTNIKDQYLLIKKSSLQPRYGDIYHRIVKGMNRLGSRIQTRAVS